MPQFSYKAYNANGKLEAGVVNAASSTDALDRLANRGLTPFSIDKPTGAAGVPWWAREVALFGDPIPRVDLARFFRSFALLHRARLPVPMALGLASEDIANRRLAALLAQAEREVNEGRRLADAIEGRGDIVPARFVALVRVGEESNRLGDTTARAADILEREVAFRAELRSALTYPVLLLIASLAVLGAIVFLLAPTLAPVFSAVRVEPPFMIRMMMAIRSAVITYWPAIAAGGAVLIVVFVLLLRGARSAVQNLLITLPFIGPTLKAAECARAVTTLSMMLQSGAPMLTALNATRDACTLDAYRDLFATAEDSVRAGGALSSALSGSTLFPRLALQMIRIGEQSDRLQEMLGNAGTTLDTQVQTRMQGLLRLLTPALTILIGSIVGALIFSTLTAILEINELAF